MESGKIKGLFLDDERVPQDVTWINYSESIYEDNGYASREHYLECLSEDYNVPLDTVEALANLYGEVEMFDGLVTALQDIEGVYE